MIMSFCLQAQEHENVEQVGRLWNFWEGVYEVEVIGDYAYVAAGRSGLQVVDISDPEHPRIAGYWDDNPSRAYDVKVRGDYAYLADWNGGLIIVDISDPENPIELGACESGWITQMSVRGNYAYVVAQDPHDHDNNQPHIRIVDISNPHAPREISIFETAGRTSDIVIRGNYGYISQSRDGLAIIDLSDPEHPAQVGFYAIDDEFSDFAVNDDNAFIPVRNTLLIIDISNPNNPSEIGLIELQGQVTDVGISGDFAYLANRFGGMRVFNISDPQNPEEAGLLESDQEISGVTISGEFAFLWHNGFGWGGAALRIVNVQNPDQIRDVGAYENRGYARIVALSNDYAYVGSYSEGLCIADISDPGNPAQVALYDSTRSIDWVTIADNYAYIVDEYYGGLRIVDITDPEDPEEVGFYDTPGDARMVSVNGDYAYIADGEEGVLILDISDRSNPGEIGLYPTHDANCVVVEGDYCYVYDYCGLSIVDFSDPESPVEISFTDTGGYPLALSVDNGYAYATSGNYGLYIIDVSNPYRPVQKCRYFGNGITGEVAFLGDYVCALYYNGFEVLDISDPENPEAIGFYDTPGDADGIAASEDGLIFVADGTNFGIYRFEHPDVVMENDQFSPDGFFLSPAYPNPFNSTTTISYGLRHPGNVSLQLHNTAGQTLNNLFQGYKQAGVYSINMKAGAIPSGIYLVNLEVSDQRFSRKVMLIR